jgi:hypothetical protein
MAGKAGQPDDGQARPGVSAVLPDNRCAWWSGNKRCRYIGTISASIATDKFQPQFYCTAHFQLGDGNLGSQIVDDSHREVPDGWDYSTANVVARAKRIYHENAPRGPAMSPEQRAEITRKWPQIGLLEPSEDDKERAAIQDEGDV